MRFSQETMRWVFLEIKENNFISPSSQQLLSSPPNLQSNSSFDLNSKISPSILLIIIILSIIFFISGLLHLLVRFLLTPTSRDQDDFDNVTALQGQLQQLFNLHDSGVDQSFIDTLPVFHYKSIIGLKNPFDCAVCLSEFEPEDKLRLLPKCSHAFHMDCIDTWLLSHSTCPLCRSCLLPDFSSQSNTFPPYVLVLESGSDSSREIVTDRDNGVMSNSANVVGRSSSVRTNSNSHLGFDGDHEFGSNRFHLEHKPRENDGKEDNNPSPDSSLVVPVKLGKFRNVDGGEGSSNNVSGNSNLDGRRCFSMGSYEYVMDEESRLKVSLSTKKQPVKKHPLSGHRAAMSECDGDSRREFRFNAFESMRIDEETKGNCNEGNNGIGKSSKKESFSVSKIWLRGGKKDKQNSAERLAAASSSRRAFSFRFPVQRSASIDSNGDRKGKCNMSCDEENQKSENSESLETKTPSFARRTMLWLVGRQNKVVHSSTPNV